MAYIIGHGDPCVSSNIQPQLVYCGRRLIPSPEAKALIYQIFSTVTQKWGFPMTFGTCDKFMKEALVEATKLQDVTGYWVTLIASGPFSRHVGQIHQIPVIRFQGQFYLFNFANVGLDGTSAETGQVFVSREIFAQMREELDQTQITSMEIVAMYKNQVRSRVEIDVFQCDTLAKCEQLPS